MLLALGIAGCTPRTDTNVTDTVGVGLAGAAAPGVGAGRAADYTAEDVRFLQRMIRHHAQALKMSALARTRTRNGTVRLLADRILVSQGAEIEMMRGWLRDRHEVVPDSSMDSREHDSIIGMPADESPGHSASAAATDRGAMTALMPGMLTPGEMTALADASAGTFDRLFLQEMIRHHQGALNMVAALLQSSGAVQDAEVFQLASEITSGQCAEIERMRALLASLPTDATAPH